MPIHALIHGEYTVKLWGLSSHERLARQLKEAGGMKRVTRRSDVPATGPVLLLNGHFLFEVRTLQAMKSEPNALLKHSPTGDIAAVMTDKAGLTEAINLMEGLQDGDETSIRTVTTSDLAAFDETLKKAQAPLLEPVSEDNKAGLESRLYGNAYKGITDLVTKFVWPRPARKAVQLAASARMTPNMVTSVGLVLVIAACYLFLNGQYLAGLAAGWCMTFLDTVDGKLARVTVQSSKFGNLYDHIIDLVHPPFWYIYWGMSLTGFSPVLGFDQQQLYWLILVAYVLGRLVEGVFPLLGNCGIFTWRPFDAWFRLVTARRNPCLIILTASALTGRPDWGFVGVAFWSAITTFVLLARLAQGVAVRLRDGPLESWLDDERVAVGPNAAAFRVFGSTRGAYGS